MAGTMRIARKKILWIDSDRFRRSSLAVMLTRFGHEVHIEALGSRAWQRLQAGRFDLVLLRDRLADMPCLRLLRIMQAAQRKDVIVLGGVSLGQQSDPPCCGRCLSGSARRWTPPACRWWCAIFS